MDDLKNIVETLLFVAEEPLAAERIKKLLVQPETAEIHAALEALQADYAARRGGFYLTEVAGGFQFRTRPEYNGWVRRLLDPRPVRLSKAALETLAIIAYKQPVIRADVEHIRGVDCGGVLRQLLERKLVRVLGRREIPGRPLVYATTKKFLETFDLKDLKDLPTPKEIEEFGKTPLEGIGNIAVEPDGYAESPEGAEPVPDGERPAPEAEPSGDGGAAAGEQERYDAEAAPNESQPPPATDGSTHDFAPATEPPPEPQPEKNLDSEHGTT
jgi:segregation and condensation protein B